jgi:hypothetical protein
MSALTPTQIEEAEKWIARDANSESPIDRLIALYALEQTAKLEAAQRDGRQKIVSDWCAAAFGVEHASSLPQRGIRLLEEAVELAQACGCAPDMAHKLIDFVFSRPVGKISQELGGVGVTLLALAAAAGHSADGEEASEVARVLAKPPSYFTARDEAKNAAGFNVAASLPSAPAKTADEPDWEEIAASTSYQDAEIAARLRAAYHLGQRSKSTTTKG